MSNNFLVASVNMSCDKESFYRIYTRGIRLRRMAPDILVMSIILKPLRYKDGELIRSFVSCDPCHMPFFRNMWHKEKQ